jgi:thiamine pyrophosphate-dependent acetolactate synthase large subunit-like protein
MGEVHANAALAFTEAGVKRAFTVPSAHNLELLGALQSADIEVIPSRCELSAGHMADGYARRSGQATLLVTSTGPGAGNSVGAFATAAKDCSPLIHVTTSNEYGNAQTVHRVPEQAAWHQAFDAPVIDLGGQDVGHLRQVLKTRVGALTVVIPYRSDRQRGLERRFGETSSESTATAPGADSEDLTAGFSPWLVAARRMLWIGGGARLAGRDILVQLAEASGAAVFTSVQGKDLFPHDHPQFVGCTLQSTLSRSVARTSEVCLALGSRMSETSTATWTQDFPPLLLRVARSGNNPEWPQTDIRSIGDDVAAACAALLRSLMTQAIPSFGREAGDQALHMRTQQDRSTPQYGLLDAITSHLSTDDTFVCDTTKMAFWAIGGSRLPVGSRFLFPGLLSMGFGVPAGVGACWAAPEAHTIVLTGDGSLLSVLPVLDDVARAPGRISIVLMDDDGYGILRPRASEAVAGDLCTFPGPDWESVASAFGIEYVDVGDPRNLSRALDARRSRPVLLRLDESGLAMDGWTEA